MYFAYIQHKSRSHAGNFGRRKGRRSDRLDDSLVSYTPTFTPTDLLLEFSSKR